MRFSLGLYVLAYMASTEAFAPSTFQGVSFQGVSQSQQTPLSSSPLALRMAGVDIVEKQKVSKSADPSLAQGDLTNDLKEGDDENFDDEYKKGIAIIGFITLLNASLAPVWHTVFATGNGPPPLFLNAVVSIVALVGLLIGGSFLDSSVESSSALAENNEEKWSMKSFRGGIELGLWKGLGKILFS